MNNLPHYESGIGPIDCSRSAKGFPDKKRIIVSVAILLMWLAVVITVSAKHELYRDEVRALSIALEPNWFWQLPTTLKNEGHPVLWYLILRAGFSLTQTSIILKVTSICIAFGAVFVFFRYAPFPVWQKTLFLWGMFPLYFYSVMARNYGISMLLFFLFSALYKRKKETPVLLACVLCALANTNVHSCILVGVLAILWFWDELVIRRRFLSTHRIIVFSCAVAVVGVGILGAAATSFPDEETVVTGVFSLKAQQIIQAFWMSVKHPGIHFGNVLGSSALLRDVLIWVLIAGLLIQPMAAVSLFVGTVLLGLFFTTVYPGAVYHQGIFIVFLISLYWMAHEEQHTIKAKGKLIKPLRLVHNVSVYVVLSAILSSHVMWCIHEIPVDLFEDFSSSKAFGEFLETHPEYRKAIIMGEPDSLLESLPYYAPNRIYIPRERRFGNRAMLTRASKERLALSELLSIAQEIKNTEKNAVLVALGHSDLFKYSRYESRYPINKIFTSSFKELTKFTAETFKIAEFKSAVSDENYQIYLLR
jgi:hypothetical protein